MPEWPSPERRCLVRLEEIPEEPGVWWVCARCGERYTTLTAGQSAKCGSGATPPTEAPGASRSDDRSEQAARPVGRVTRSPGGDSVRLELTPEEVADLANRILVRMVDAPDLEPTAQVWIAMLFLATAQLSALGVPHTEVMQMVTVAWNGKETGIFKLAAGGAEGRG